MSAQTEIPVALSEIQSGPIVSTPSMQRLYQMAESVSRRTCTVLIRGESGSGKELIARQIHAWSPRREQPFLAVDCTTLKDSLLESQLFGHRKGAFTGADRSTLGFFRSADGGTLFLDEIGELSLPVQAKLLRCIQDRAVVPLGDSTPIPVDVRVLAATHRDLRAMVRRGEFREDLYFRLNVVEMLVPPLRDRKPDIATLARHFLDHFARLYGDPVKFLTPDAVRALEEYAWPGNVRELSNAMERAHILGEGMVVTVADLPEELQPASAWPPTPILKGGEIPTLRFAEQLLIARALNASGGNKTRAAEILQIGRHRLHRKIRAYGL